MQYVLTLTCDPDKPILDDTHVGRARDALVGAGVTGVDHMWLSAGRALDVTFEAPRIEPSLNAVREALDGIATDINQQPLDGRRKNLLIADMDSTIITEESLDALADFIGIKDQVAPVTARAMRGEIDFDTALRDRVRLLEGQPTDLLDRLLEERIHLTGGAEALVRTMVANGAFTALVSGGFTFVTEAVAKRVGFATHRGNVLLTRDGAITGEVAEPILGKEAKLASLREFCSAHGLTLDQTMAVGDGANDIPMLLGAGMGIAFHAKPAVAAAARFTVDHGDLTSLLYLQGYRDDDFILA